MKMRLQGSYSGIGIYIGMKNKKLMVISPISDTPAAKAGLKSMDVISAIDGKSAKDMALEEAVSIIRGPQGTYVKLEITRRGEKKPFDVSIVREKIVVKSVEKKELEGNIGYIKLNTFENINASDEMSKAINFFRSKGAKGLIVDVRGNGGGLLSNAVEISGMFLPKGAPIVSTVDREKQKETINATGNTLWTGPLVILINEGSASASEILSGAIRDNKAGILVGYHSFGKASVQNIRQLDDGSALLVTIAKYLTPDGEDISKKGLKPQVLVKTGREVEPGDISKNSSDESDAIDEIIPKDDKDDVQLKKAVEVLKKIHGF
jgi:carboxyl-terminal processing protease